jgi:hypothetical protein
MYTLVGHLPATGLVKQAVRCARWNEGLSSHFIMGSGVRQGSTISPSPCNVFINKKMHGRTGAAKSELSNQ